jgi:DNA-binding transcriptional LysR family regulator
MNLSNLDINLLYTLHVLLHERNVTNAAAKLSLTQPAVSNALGRLREIFKDELLVRSGRALVPTPKAERMKPDLAAIVEQMEFLLSNRAGFQPSTVEKHFSIACSDVIEISVLPRVLKAFKLALPKCSLKIVTIDRLYQEDLLANGTVDVMIGMPPNTLPGCREEALYEDERVCLYRTGLLPSKISLSRFTSIPHIRIAPMASKYDEVDTALNKLGKTRTIALEVPHFAIVPAILAQQDLIAVVPLRLAEHYGKAFNLSVVKAPIDLSRLEIRMMWHRRAETDDGGIFFRQLIRDSLKSKT